MGLILIIFLLQGCNGSDAGAKEGTDNAEQCVQADLIAQCPPGTTPDLISNAAAVCSMSGSVDISQGTDNLQGVRPSNRRAWAAVHARSSVASGSLPQRNQSLHDDGIECNQFKPAMENAMRARTRRTPIDCGNECQPGLTRCNGDQLQTCSQLGE